MMNRLACALALTMWLAAPAVAQQKVESPPDPYVHAGTGFVLPAALGPFVRESVTDYAGDGSDVGTNYEMRVDGKSVAIVTIYVYPLPEEGGGDEAKRCSAYFDGARQAITGRFAGATLISAGKRPAPDPDADTSGSHASYAITADFFAPGGAVASGLTLYCPKDTGWQVKYRTSVPADGTRDAAVQQFLRALEWPNKLGG